MVSGYGFWLWFLVMVSDDGFWLWLLVMVSGDGVALCPPPQPNVSRPGHRYR